MSRNVQRILRSTLYPAPKECPESIELTSYMKNFHVWYQHNDSETIFAQSPYILDCLSALRPTELCMVANHLANKKFPNRAFWKSFTDNVTQFMVDAEASHWSSLLNSLCSIGYFDSELVRVISEEFLMSSQNACLSDLCLFLNSMGKFGWRNEKIEQHILMQLEKYKHQDFNVSDCCTLLNAMARLQLYNLQVLNNICQALIPLCQHLTLKQISIISWSLGKIDFIMCELFDELDGRLETLTSLLCQGDETEIVPYFAGTVSGFQKIKRDKITGITGFIGSFFPRVLTSLSNFDASIILSASTRLHVSFSPEDTYQIITQCIVKIKESSNIQQDRKMISPLFSFASKSYSPISPNAPSISPYSSLVSPQITFSTSPSTVSTVGELVHFLMKEVKVENLMPNEIQVILFWAANFFGDKLPSEDAVHQKKITMLVESILTTHVSSANLMRTLAGSFYAVSIILQYCSQHQNLKKNIKNISTSYEILIQKILHQKNKITFKDVIDILIALSNSPPQNVSYALRELLPILDVHMRKRLSANKANDLKFALEKLSVSSFYDCPVSVKNFILSSPVISPTPNVPTVPSTNPFEIETANDNQILSEQFNQKLKKKKHQNLKKNEKFYEQESARAIKTVKNIVPEVCKDILFPLMSSVSRRQFSSQRLVNSPVARPSGRRHKKEIRRVAMLMLSIYRKKKCLFEFP